jgi:hypothetical protein
MQTSTSKQWPCAVLVMMFLIFNGGSVFLRAQEGCRGPELPSVAHELNIFNEQQEADLGDAMAEHLQHNYRVSNDEQLRAYDFRTWQTAVIDYSGWSSQ